MSAATDAMSIQELSDQLNRARQDKKDLAEWLRETEGLFWQAWHALADLCYLLQCPKCDAPPEHRCLNLLTYDKPTKWPHAERCDLLAERSGAEHFRLFE